MFDWPNSPTTNQVVTGALGESYTWDGTKWVGTVGVPGASSTLPLMDGTAAVGTGTTWARADHVHPSDTSRAPLASPTFTGTVTLASLSATSTVTAGNGRVVSQNAANSPALAMWDTTNSHGMALHIDTGGNLFFGTSDVNGNPVTNFAYMDTGGNLVLTNASIMANSGEISVGGAGLVVSGTKVVGAQITGYGTPTGGVKTASFPGASATLAQTSAQLAQLILDLKTHGLLGA